ncbi:MAG: hypothetical protein QM529_04700 [Hydrotalea sp.]|nr:hypothetical protein [Hydrotalea sp.]
MDYSDLTYGNFFRQTWFYKISALFLLVACPGFAMVLYYTNQNLDGSFYNLGQYIWQHGLWSLLHDAWFSRFFGTPTAWGIIGIFAAGQLLLMRILPGKKYDGPITPTGHVPRYKNNGLLSYIVTYGLFFGFSLLWPLFPPSIIYDNFGDILAALNITALMFCLFLYAKGRFAPSTRDNSVSSSFIFDYYWGTELYPRLFGWDIKQFTNCRFGMTGWSLAVVSFAFAQKNIHGAADWSIILSAALIAIYLFKFFIWESGYMRSMDIMTDRAGFYICWGCLVWVPAVYTSPVMFMVNHPIGLPFAWGLVIFLLGLGCIGVNYWADRQRQMVRETNGKAKIWGRAPRLIRAPYKTIDGKKKESLLLASGFWGISRHFHYVPEIGAALCWSVATGFGYFMPFFYVVFLTILLTHRAIRDDKKCAKKYGPAWQQYRKLVPYKIVPHVF